MSAHASRPGAIVLLSGGLDSTVALADTLARLPVVCTLTFDYGQRAARQELAATRAIAAHYAVSHRVIRLPWLSELLPQALTPLPALVAQGIEAVAPEEAALFDVQRVWVPNRNGLFLNIAACFAEAMGVQTIVFGANAEEGESFPDNTPAFRDQLNAVFGFSTLNGVRVETPVGDWHKTRIIERGLALDVPFSLIWSCYEDGAQQCGQCPSCLRVKAARDGLGRKAALAFQDDEPH